MAPFLRISFNSFELGPVQNQGEQLQPFCAIKMKEALTTGEVTNGDAFLNVNQLLRNPAVFSVSGGESCCSCRAKHFTMSSSFRMGDAAMTSVSIPTSKQDFFLSAFLSCGQRAQCLGG